MRHFIVLAALGASACAAGAADAARPEMRLLSQMKAACGGSAWDRIKSWHEKNEADIKGMPPIQNDVWHDMQSLKSSMTSSANGQVIRKTGYNGISAWRVGPDGQVKIISDENLLRRQRRDAYLSSFGWFFPKRFPAKFTLLPDRRRDGLPYKVLKIDPKDSDPLELWIDSSSNLVRRIVAGDEYAELSEYKTFDGVCTATLGRQGNGTPEQDMLLRVIEVRTSQRAPAAAFDPPGP